MATVRVRNGKETDSTILDAIPKTVMIMADGMESEKAINAIAIDDSDNNIHDILWSRPITLRIIRRAGTGALKIVRYAKEADSDTISKIISEYSSDNQLAISDYIDLAPENNIIYSNSDILYADTIVDLTVNLTDIIGIDGDYIISGYRQTYETYLSQTMYDSFIQKRFISFIKNSVTETSLSSKFLYISPNSDGIAEYPTIKTSPILLSLKVIVPANLSSYSITLSRGIISKVADNLSADTIVLSGTNSTTDISQTISARYGDYLTITSTPLSGYSFDSHYSKYIISDSGTVTIAVVKKNAVIDDDTTTDGSLLIFNFDSNYKFKFNVYRYVRIDHPAGYWPNSLCASQELGKAATLYTGTSYLSGKISLISLGIILGKNVYVGDRISLEIIGVTNTSSISELFPLQTIDFDLTNSQQIVNITASSNSSISHTVLAPTISASIVEDSAVSGAVTVTGSFTNPNVVDCDYVSRFIVDGSEFVSSITSRIEAGKTINFSFYYYNSSIPITVGSVDACFGVTLKRSPTYLNNNEVGAILSTKPDTGGDVTTNTTTTTA